MSSDDNFGAGLLGGFIGGLLLSLFMGVVLLGPTKLNMVRRQLCEVMEHYSTEIPVRWSGDRCEAQIEEDVWVNIESLSVGE